MKIWARTVNEEKITRDLLYEIESVDDLTRTMQEICEQMDIPTPIVSSMNESHFAEFNTTKFRPRDFVESVDFEFLEIEYCK